MTFTITEAEVIRLTGYSRQHLKNLRLGNRQVQGGKVYVSSAVLVKGVDWVQHSNRALFYARHVVDELRKRKDPG